MKRYRYYAILCCLLLAAACHKDEDDKLPPGKYPLEITAHLADGFSRSVPGKDTWTGGEKVEVWMWRERKKMKSIYTMAADGTMTSDTPLYWEDNGNVVVDGYYPVKSTGDVDISDQSGGFADFDYLVAVENAKFGQPVELQFTHYMTKIRVELITAVDVEKVEIMSYRTINFDESGGFHVNDMGYITACRDGESDNYEVLMPGTIAFNDFIKVTGIDGKEYFYSAEGKSQDRGDTYVYTITVGDGMVHNLDNNTLAISDNGTHFLIGDGTETTGCVTVNGNATIVLSNMNIKSSTTPSIKVESGTPTFVLVGENRLENDNHGYTSFAALNNASGTEITIQGKGSLTATSSNGAAGIGGNCNENSGKIVIKDGNINARGGYATAGIGSGYYATCEGISILGGKVTATWGGRYEGVYGAIGTSVNGTCTAITLGNCEIHVPGDDGSIDGKNGIVATAITPSLSNKAALTAAGVKIYVNGVLYNDN